MYWLDAKQKKSHPQPAGFKPTQFWVSQLEDRSLIWCRFGIPVKQRLRRTSLDDLCSTVKSIVLYTIFLWIMQKIVKFSLSKTDVIFFASLMQCVVFIIFYSTHGACYNGYSCTYGFWAAGACTPQFSGISVLICTFSEFFLTLSFILKNLSWKCDF